jgi:multidrug transporter EmrE-like cation transporter
VSAKLASRTINSPERSTLVFIAGTYFFFLLRGILWVFLLRKIKLVLAYPLMSVGYILVLFVSFLFFDESLTPGKIIGAILLMAGVSAVSYGEVKIHLDGSP